MKTNLSWPALSGALALVVLALAASCATRPSALAPLTGGDEKRFALRDQVSRSTPALAASGTGPASVATTTPAAGAAAIEQLQQSFIEPPDSAKPKVRWWWFGPSVVQSEMLREMTFMKEGGFGGFEVQPTYAMSLNDQPPGLKNFAYLSPEFFADLRYAADQAKQLGLRMDLTLGSGWPYGGPMFTAAEAAGALKTSVATVAPGQTSVPLPAGAAGGRGRGTGGPGTVAAALLGPVAHPAAGASPYQVLTLRDGAALLPTDLDGATTVTFFLNGGTGMQVKRPAIGAAGNVLDHYSPAVVAKFIHDVAEPEVLACGPNAPYSVFCDSLEVDGEDWTPDFLAEFQKRRGYDLTPWLPALYGNPTPANAGIRYDWGRTITDIFNDVFVQTLEDFAHAHNSQFRIQAYGTPPTNLSSYAHSDLTEGEGFTWKTFSTTRWATSAGHLIGHPVISSECLTWLHQAVFLASPLDMKAEVNLHFLQGVNQILCHGWPYTAPGVDYPGWRFYAAAVFDEKNPWWIVMPDVTKYIARVGQLLRQGQPANDVALYLPEADAWANTRAGAVKLTDLVGRRVGASVAPLLNAGYNFDFFDDGILATNGRADHGALAFGEVKYPAVVLPNVEYMPLATLRQLDAFARGGGVLIAVGRLPSAPAGQLVSAEDRQAFQNLVQGLFQGPGAKGLFVADESQLATALTPRLRPDVAFAQGQTDLGFVHRHTDAGELYFVANTANQPRATTAIFRVTGLQAEWWDPVTGRISPAQVTTRYSDATEVNLDLAPYEAQVLVFTTRALPPSPPAGHPLPPLDLSRGWDVTFKNASAEPDPAPAHYDTLRFWTNDSPYFSGVATYTKQLDVPAAQLAPGAALWLDFGTGTPTPVSRSANGMAAYYDPPVHEAAVVYINGHRVGALWSPPYRVDVTGLLQPGANEVRVVTANLAANYMANPAHPPIQDLAALQRVYGHLFDPQGMNLIHSFPSGLAGPIQLLATAPPTP